MNLIAIIQDGQPQIGGFRDVKTLADRYVCDGIDYPFSILSADHRLGDYTDVPVVDAASLAKAKAERNSQINLWRAQANQTTFAHLGKLIACDALSRSDIDAVAGAIALNGTFPAGFPNAWKAVDNTYLSLPDIASFKAMYNSMTLQGTTNFARSQELKAQVAAATTIEQLGAIVW